MKKILCLVSLLTLCLALCACSGSNSANPTECAHDYKIADTTESTCITVGVICYECSKCNHIYQVELPQQTHIYAEATCVAPKTCKICGATEGAVATAHSYVNNKCELCGIPAPSKGLRFTKTGQSYCVSGIGTCTDTDIVIPSTYYERPVTSIGDRAFYNCSKLTSITIPDSVTNIGDSAFHNCRTLTNITIPDSVTSIGEKAFFLCSSLTSITIPDSVTNIGKYAFEGCSSLVSIVIPNSVTSIGSEAFWGCSSLTNVTIGNSVTSIGNHAFYNCSNLTSITIPDSVTSIGDGAFYHCINLTSITIPDSVTNIGDIVFSYCINLTSITIPDSVTSIGTGTFAGSNSLTGIWVDGNNSAYCSDSSGVLYNKDKTVLVAAPCKLPGSYTIPSTVTSIGEEAFCLCSSLTSITIPDSVTSIGDGAFYRCSNLTSITIPDSVASIGNGAFGYCSNLTQIHFAGTKAQWNVIAKNWDFGIILADCTVYCIDGNIQK